MASKKTVVAFVTGNNTKDIKEALISFYDGPKEVWREMVEAGVDLSGYSLETMTKEWEELRPAIVESYRK